MVPEARAAAHLWRWASKRLGGSRVCSLDAHYDTAQFMDAVDTASHVMRRLMPLARGVAHLRHFIRGTQMPPELDDLEMLDNWNGAEGFREGAEQAHLALLAALSRPAGTPVWPPFRESLGPEAVRWLETARDAEKWPQQEAMDVAAAVGDSTSSTSSPSAAPEVTALSLRFERLHGPRSLERIREMSVTGLRSVRDPEVMECFHHDTFHGGTLQLEVASIAESTCAAKSEGAQRIFRRYDRLHLACDFNLREGIASPFRISSVEELLAEQFRPRERRDDEGCE